MTPRERERERERRRRRRRRRRRWFQVTPGVTIKNYTFFKLLDLSRCNGKKRPSLMLIF